VKSEAGSHQSAVEEDAGKSETLYPLRFWLALSMLLLLCTIIKLPTLLYHHDEPDEQIYLSLAKRLITAGEYNLTGTDILSRLSPGIYEHPLFFHPPLFTLCLMPFVYWNVENLAVVVSWLGHLLCIVSVALIGRRMTFAYELNSDRNILISWLPVIGMALDPFLTVFSRRLWIDSFLAGLCAASLAAFFCARYSQRRSLWLVAGGVFFGLAGLCKITALIFAPVLLYLILTAETQRQSKIKDLCLGSLPALLLLLPWFVIFYRKFGVIIPSWTKPDEWLLQHYAFVRLTLERTPIYYVVKLIAIAPVILLSFGVYLFRRSLWTNRVFLAFPISFLLYFVSMSYLGLHGYGFQMRYLAPAIPAIYVMLYAVLANFERSRELLSFGILMLLLYGGVTGVILIVAPGYDEIISIFELIGWLRI